MKTKIYPTEVLMYCIFAFTFFYMALRLVGVVG